MFERFQHVNDVSPPGVATRQVLCAERPRSVEGRDRVVVVVLVVLVVVVVVVVAVVGVGLEA